MYEKGLIRKMKGVKQTYLKNIKSGSFILLLLLPFLLVAIFFAAEKIYEDNYDIETIGVVSNLPATFKQLKEIPQEEFHFEKITTKKQAKKRLMNNKIDAYIVLNTSSTSVVRAKLYSKIPVGINVEDEVSSIASELQRNLRAEAIDLDGSLVDQIIVPARFSFHRVGFQGRRMEVIRSGSAGFKYLVYSFTTLTLFIFLILFIPITTGEFSQKDHRSYLSKLMGIALVGLTQFIVWSGVGIGFYQLFKESELLSYFVYYEPVKIILDGDFLALILLMLLGFLLFITLASLNGLIGKKINEQPSGQTVVILIIAAFAVNRILGEVDAGNQITAISSYIPFLSQFSMPLRIASDAVTTNGALSAVVILLGSWLLLTGFGSWWGKNKL
ncbi:ABC transporter permease [Enterococcus alishanensis]